MKRSVLLISMFLTAPSFATPESAIEILNTLNEGKVTSGGEQCFEGDDVSELEECAVALCGPAETAAVATVNDANFDFYVQEDVKEKLPLLDESVKKIFDKKKAELEKFIADFKTLQENSKPIVDFSKWTYEYNYFTYKTYDDFYEFETDTTKPYAERLTLKLKPPQGASRAYIKGLKAYAEAKKKERETNIVYGMYEEFYTVEESQEIIGDIWKKFYEAYEKEVAKNPDFMKDSAEEIEKYLEEESRKLSDSYDLGEAYREIYELNNKLLSATNQPTTPLQYGVDCEEDCKGGIRDYLQGLDYSSMIKDLEKKKDEVTLEDNITGCQAELIDRGLKESDKEQFLAHFPETKRQFLDKVFANYSAHSRKAFEKYLEEELNLSFDRYSNETPDDLLTKLKEEAEAAPSETSTTPDSLISKLLDHQDWSDKSKMTADISVCDDNGGRAFAAWDAYSEKGGSFDEADADPSKDNIFVSLFTCSHVPQGKGVVTHEMGHAMSYAFKNGKLSVESKAEYLKVRECVTKSHITTNETPRSVHPGDKQYSEEDTADVVSYNAIAQDGPIFTCALLDTTKEGTRFKDLSLVNKHSLDSHSSPLLRVLRESIYKKRRLPSACKQIIEKNKDKFRFEPCT